jgi:agmatine/peptidylarginine deiminase
MNIGRNPHMSKDQIEQMLKDHLNADKVRVMWDTGKFSNSLLLDGRYDMIAHDVTFKVMHLMVVIG